MKTTKIEVPKLIRRLLAAIMFTDIVGYTAMMNENEIAAVAHTTTPPQCLSKLLKEFPKTGQELKRWNLNEKIL